MTESPNHDHESTLAAADPELEQLLEDAYDAPPMPRSLLQRVDQAVEAEWGESPKLAESRTARWTSSLSGKVRWARSLPVAASLALLVVLAVVFSGESQSYAWDSMIEALERHGLVQIEDTDETGAKIRWLSLADGVISERTADSSRLVNLREQFVLDRRDGTKEIQRRKLDSATSDRDQLVLGFLLGDPLPGDDSEDLSGIRLVDESWKSITVDGAEQIVLRVRFETDASSRFELSLKLDPESQLPSSVEVLSGDVAAKSLAVSYPDTTLADLNAQDFPADLVIVDVGEDGNPIVSVTTSDPGTSIPGEDPGVAVATSDLDRPLSPVAPEVDVTQPPLFGVPSKWRAVSAVDLSAGEVVDQIDTLLADLWKKNNLTPADKADEEELLRRVYLDLVGRTPSVNEIRTYLADESPKRYESLVDRLLASPDHASHIATIWRTFLIPEGVDLARFGGVQAFDQWLSERFASDDSYDEVVRSLLLAEGRLAQSGPLLFYSAVNLEPEQLAARTARVFLGMRLECAQCHDHPFEPWSQDEFWGFAAFFAQISRPQVALQSVSTVMQVRDVDRGEVRLPDTETVVLPSLLDGAEISQEAQARRQQLAHWLTGTSNPYFARATANRVWGQLFGKGIVDPIDDFGTEHKPKSAELIDLLAGHFINSGFSLRELFRTAVLSRAYQLSSGAGTVDENRPEWFAQMNIKTLTAEQVYDCITVATLLDTGTGEDAGAFNLARIGNAPRDAFVQQFRTPSGRMTEYQGGIPQALTLMNGSLIAGATGLSSSGLLKSLEAPFFTNEQRMEVLYLATLSRRPRPSESELLKGYISDDASGAELRDGLSDILWALLNSAEFTLNH